MIKWIAILLSIVSVNAAMASYQPRTVTSTASADQILRVAVNGGVSPTLGTQGGTWVSSVTRNSVGDYTLTFSTGIFSGVPVCWCMAIVFSTSGGVCTIETVASGSVRMETYQGGVTSPSDQNFSAACVGPR